jgi:hypothetical protein
VTKLGRSSWLAALLFAGVALLAATAVSAAGAGRYVFDQRCDEILHLCWSTAAEGGDVYLGIESAEHGGEYRVCVTPPRGSGACRAVRLHRRPPGAHGYVGYVGRVAFEEFAKPVGAGQYIVHWKSAQGFPVGPALAFRLRANGEPDRAG